MTGPARSRDELISSFSSKLFSAMLHEVIMDVTLQSHRDIIRSRTLCAICGTRCGSVHEHGGHSNGAGPSAGASSSCIPAPSTPTTNSTASGSNMPVAKEKNDGNIYFECTNCQKKIASNRYAPHLSGCLGIGTGSRRGAARNAAAKNKLGTETDRGASPLLGSDYGSPAHETINGKGKGKGKNKKINGKVIDAGMNGNIKRPQTSDISLAKKAKKQKTSAADSEMTMLVGDGTATKPQIPLASKIPLKSAVNPTSPGSPSGGSGSQYSGHDSPSASASRSVSSLAQSPTSNLGPRPLKSYNMSSDSPQKKRPRPPSSSRIQAAAIEVAVVKQKMEKDDPDFIDVDGEEQEDSSSDSS